MRIISFLFLVLLTMLGITFAGLNAQPVLLKYYVGEYELPLSMLVALTLGVGLLFGLFTTVVIYLRLKRQNYKLKSKLRVIEKEVENLRSLPLRDS